MKGSQQSSGPDDAKGSKQPKEIHPDVSKDGGGIENAAKLLAQFIDPDNLLRRKEGFPRRPLVIFAFDEAHILTDNPPTKNRATKWNLFSELRLFFGRPPTRPSSRSFCRRRGALTYSPRR